MAGQTRRRQATQVTGDAEAARRGTGDADGPPTAAVDMPAFVGREDVLAAVMDALDRGPSLVLIEGEAGIGKTRLVHEVLALRQDSVVLVAACPPLREPFPLGPVVDGVRRLRDDSDDVELSALGGALRPLFPEWADRLPPALEPLDDPTEVRGRIFRALSELVRRLDVRILVVEDAHWADTATLEWLLTLTAAEPADGDSGMSVVVTYRPDDVPEGSLLVRLTSRPPTAGMQRLRVALEPLDVEQTRLLVGSMLQTEEVSEEFARFLHERTDGVPLAVEESIRLMRERHDIIHRGGVWTRKVLDELEVPPTVRDSVLERVDRLEPEAREILRAAAILAAPADETLLATVADLGQQPARRGVARALAAGLLRAVGTGRLGFRHVLDAKAVEESIPASERWHLHSRAAGALEQLDPLPVARLARHFREANDTEEWCHYAEAAADTAWDAGDDRTAVVTLLELLTSIEHPIERRVRLVRKLGETAYFGVTALGDLADQVVQALRDALAEQDLPRGQQGELRLLLGRMLWEVSGEHAAFDELEAAIPDLGHRPDLAIRAMMNLALPYSPDWPAARHLSWLQRATELLPQADSPPFQVNRAAILLLLGENAGWQALNEIREPPSGVSDRRRLARGLLNAAEAILVWGRYGEARQQLDAAVEHIEEADYQREVSRARVTGSYLAWYTGVWQGLRDAATKLAESDEVPEPERLQAAQLVGLLDLASGARTSAERQLRQVMTDYERRGVAEPQGVTASAALGRLCLADGAIEEALRVTAPVMDMIARKGVWLWATDVTPTHLDALIQTARLAEAEALLAEFAAGVRGRRAPGPAASLLVCRGMAAEAHGDPHRAAAFFKKAAAAWAVLPRPYDELLALECQGHCLLGAGERDEGLTVLSDAEQRLRQLGAQWDADRIAHLLRQHGVEVARIWRRGPRGYGDQLSPRELEVVELVARGMTNKQIAETLFISPKTVTRHLYTSMRKLAVSSRTALAMAASEAGLLTSVDDH